jgi:hypothetical protein
MRDLDALALELNVNYLMATGREGIVYSNNDNLWNMSGKDNYEYH